MIYNMLTLSIQLLLIGFLVAVIAHFIFSRGRSQLFMIELTLSVVGAFMGTLLEVLIRHYWNIPLVFHLFYQFLIPLGVSILVVVVYRIANGFKE